MSVLKLWFAGWFAAWWVPRFEKLRKARRDRKREWERKFREKCDWDYKMEVEAEQWKARIWAKEMRR